MDMPAGSSWERTKVWELEPRTVQWLVDESGIGRAALARKMGVAPDMFQRWMETGRMTYACIGRLSKHTRRPPLLFFHREPLPDPPLTDYRGDAVSSTAVGTAPALSPDDIVAVRNARYLQGQAGEMLDDLVKEARSADASGRQREHAARLLHGLGRIGDEDDEKLGFKMWPDHQVHRDIRARREATLKDSPEKAARAALWQLGLTLTMPVIEECAAPPGFDALRDAVETQGNTIVLQADMDMETVRSVVLAGGEGREADTPPSTPHMIILNAGDAEGVRSFSMLHGYGHVLLGRGMGWVGKGGCICREGGPGLRRSGRPCNGMDQEEMWCDSFAAACMMPYSQFAHEWPKFEDACTLPWRTGARAMSVAGELAKAFQTSRYAAAVRMFDTCMEGKNRVWYEDLAVMVANTAGTSYGEPAEMMFDGDRGNAAACCESRCGRRLIRTALAAHELERETTHTLIDTLGIRLADIDAVGNLADGWPDADVVVKAGDARTGRGGRA